MAGAIHVVGDDGQQIRPRRLSGPDRQQDPLDRSSRRRHHRDDEEARRRRHVHENFNSIDFAPAQVPWAQGKALYWYKGSFILGSFRGDKAQCCAEPIDWFPFPAMGDKKPVMSIYDEDTVMIHAASKNKDAAAEFVNWMVSPEASAKKLEIDKPYASNASTDLSHLSPMEQRLGKAMADAGSYTFMHVDHATPPAISDRFLDGLQGVLAGAISPEEAMEATETEASACGARSRADRSEFLNSDKPSAGVERLRTGRVLRSFMRRRVKRSAWKARSGLLAGAPRFPMGDRNGCADERRTNVLRRLRAPARLRHDFRHWSCRSSFSCALSAIRSLYTIYLSFFEWNGMTPVKKFVGFANYAYMLGDKYFYISLENNLKWLAVSLVFPVVLGFLIAYAMRARAVYFPTLLRTGDILSGDDVARRGRTDVPADPQPDFRRVRHRVARARPRVSRPRVVRRLSHRDLHARGRRRVGVHRAADDLLFRRDRRRAQGDVRRGAGSKARAICA